MKIPAKVTMKIENFCGLTGNDSYKSTSFILPSNNQIKFSLYCHPQSMYNIIGDKYTTIYLHLDSCNRDQVTVRLHLSILNANGDRCKEQEKVETFYKNIGYGGIYHTSYDHLTKNEFLVNGRISIYCEVEEIESASANFFAKNEPNPKLPDSPILEDFQSLLESGKFSDASLIIKIGEKRLNVHKAILSARSKVFAAMFENDCEEKRQNRVEIIDIPAEVCEQMLSYIYTGQIPDMKNAADLFVAADKYQLEHLKAVCEQHLSSEIDVESAANTLLLADMHHATGLKTKSVDFIVDNATKVMATESWKALTNRSDLLVDLFQKMTIKANR